MDKLFLEECLNNGMSTRDIEKICDKKHNTINYWIHKYELMSLSKFSKLEQFKFEKIDSKEKAYALGFILADGAIKTIWLILRYSYTTKRFWISFQTSLMEEFVLTEL